MMDTITPDDFLVGLGVLSILVVCLSVIMQVVQGIIMYQIFKKLYLNKDNNK